RDIALAQSFRDIALAQSFRDIALAQSFQGNPELGGFLGHTSYGGQPRCSYLLYQMKEKILMLELFKQDVQRWIVPQQVADPELVTWPTTLKLLFRYMPLRAMLWFRIGSWFKHKKIPFFPGFIQRVIYSLYGLEISPGADIGGGLYIAHPIGTVVSVKRLGSNASIIAAVTIGMRNEWGFPDIGDNVFIGAGARVLGNIRIGDNVAIGANAVVIKDLPDNATAIGIPAKVIKIREKSKVKV
ncbi:MAG: serine O-acetyltransferase, partial [Ardenticatenaceae bacterium]